MRVPESIAELRRICHFSREADSSYRNSWWDRQINVVAVYFTKLFLVMGLSANQVSLVGLITLIIGGAFLIFPTPLYWLIGAGLLGLYQIIGHADGGVARYRKTASVKGAFWNTVPEQLSWLYVPACVSLGIYNAVGGIYPFIFGFLSVLSLSLSSSVILVAYPILRDKGLLAEAITATKATEPTEKPSAVIKWSRLLFGNFSSVVLWLLLATIADYFISPFAVGPIAANVRFVVLAGYTVFWLASAVRNISLPLVYVVSNNGTDGPLC